MSAKTEPKKTLMLIKKTLPKNNLPFSSHNFKIIGISFKKYFIHLFYVS